ncbi:MAG: sugar ABC transporter permease [Clostridiaceae bacterium]|nr:sugar ABC transporter permease [Clostridiaceae bacterium]
MRRAGNKKEYNAKEAREAYLLLAPFGIFFLLFVLYPIVRSVADSFTDYSLSSRDWVGFHNYLRLLRDKAFLLSVRNTLLYALGSIAPLMALGLAAALLVQRQSRAMFAARAALMTPYVTSLVAVSMVFLYLYDPTTGAFNKLLSAVGLPTQRFLYDPTQALACLVAMNIWKNFGYVMILYLAGLTGVPETLLEAASLDGAGAFAKLRYIQLPHIRPVSYLLATTLCVECFKTFEPVRLMTSGGPVNATTTITYQIYIRAFSEFKMGYASAMSVVLLVIVLAVTLLNLKFGRQLDDGGDA